MVFQPLLLWGALGELLGETLKGGLPDQVLVILCARPQQRDNVPTVPIMIPQDFPQARQPGPIRSARPWQSPGRTWVLCGHCAQTFNSRRLSKELLMLRSRRDLPRLCCSQEYICPIPFVQIGVFLCE